MVKTRCFQCREHRFDPSWGTKIPHATAKKNLKYIKRKGKKKKGLQFLLQRAYSITNPWSTGLNWKKLYGTTKLGDLQVLEARRGLSHSERGAQGHQQVQAPRAKCAASGQWAAAVALGLHELEVRPLTKARAWRAASPCKLGQKNVPAGPEDQQGADSAEEVGWCGGGRRTLWRIKALGLCHAWEKNLSLCGEGKPNWGIHVNSASRPVKTLIRYPEQQMQSTVQAASVALSTGYSHQGGTSAKLISTWFGLGMNVEMKVHGKMWKPGADSPKMSSE